MTTNDEHWQSYLQPNGTLKNMLGLTDAAVLQEVEYITTGTRQETLEAAHFVLPGHGPLTGQTVAEIRLIHHYLFAGIYAWAGKYRTVDMGKGGTDAFFPVDRFATAENDVQEKLTEFAALGTDRQVVAKSLGEIISEFNWWHPFREGNGRTQRILATLLAYQRGYHLSIQQGSAAYENYMQASIDDSPEEMANIFFSNLSPLS
ncbi:MAG: Fic family protein [Schleiferilactobacillus harbinensis]|jgi:cell filamentation protein|nr:Fic family protein [Schleiferilactobacillus harbinensis]MCI1912024.1 Fic family protein [Schleiferilactobacillus harbinensis]